MQCASEMNLTFPSAVIGLSCDALMEKSQFPHEITLVGETAGMPTFGVYNSSDQT